MRSRVPATFLLAVGLLFASVGFSQAPTAQNQPAYLNPALPIDQRVDDLVSRMTLEEKASQLVNQARAIPRLQVPLYDYWSEALHGVGFAGTATVFPQAIALSSTWDAPLLHNVAAVIGTEGRAKHYEAVRQGRRDIFEGLGPRELSLVNPAGDRIVAAGQYRLTVGGGQPDTGAASADASFAITGEMKLPD
jgi:hypothetical protein